MHAGKAAGNDRLWADVAVNEAKGKTVKNAGTVKDAVKDNLD